jgi:hypothetical protein
MIEPYPIAVRLRGVAQTDESDALASAAHLQSVDAEGHLHDLLDLSTLDVAAAAIVKLEGWIVSPKALEA